MEYTLQLAATDVQFVTIRSEVRLMGAAAEAIITVYNGASGSKLSSTGS